MAQSLAPKPPARSTVAFVIRGNLASKSNSRQFVRIGGRPRLIKSEAARSFEQLAYLQIPAWAKQGWTEPIKLSARVYYDSRRPDLDISLLQDILERAGVYKNDRQIVELHLYKGLDQKDPRVEVEVALATMPLTTQ